MNNYSAHSSRFQTITTHIVFAFFLFTTFFSGIPGMPTAMPKAHATPGEKTYATYYTYDNNSNVKSRTATNGNVIKFNYDGLNRLIEKCFLVDTITACETANADVKYAYDPNGNRISMTDSTGTTNYFYDRFNRLTEVYYPNLLYPTSYEYDKANNLTKITYPNLEEIVYGYDDNNRLTSVEDSTGITSYEYYNDTNLLRKKTLPADIDNPNGIYTDYTYDPAHRLTDVENRRADDTLISRYEYLEYDANNNVKQVRETTESGTTNTIVYTYDKLNRLKNADYSDGPDEAYTYDESGNRLTKTTPSETITYEYDGDNRLLRAGNTIFFYDDSGNLETKMTPDKTIDYTYNHENRLTKYIDGPDTIEFGYDGDGNRVTKTVNGEMTRYINDVSSPISQVLLEATEQYNLTNRYTYGFSRINQGVASPSFYLYDRPGRSVSSVVSSSGQILNDYEYDSFGNIKTANEDVINNFKYTGEQYDEETGLIYLRNRYYDPEIGRFITKDPFPGFVDAPQTENPYPYVSNNPVNFIDPAGLFVFFGVEIFFGAEIFARPTVAPRIIRPPGNWGRSLPQNAPRAPSAPRPTPPRQRLENQPPRPTGGDIWDESHPWPHVPPAGSATPQGGVMPPVMNFIASPMRSSDYNLGSFSLPESDPMVDAMNLIGPKIYDPDNILGDIFGGPSYFNDFGGVSLSKTATFMGDINDIEGAAYDAYTGQIILYGKTDTSPTPLPPMDMDDLAVAVRSVYGYGGVAPQDPGVSIDPYNQSYMKVRYDGQTFDTNFGYVMYEADRVLKAYMLGKDNITNGIVSSGVGGYSSLLERRKSAIINGYYTPTGSSTTRMWFVPQEITLKIQEDEYAPSPSMIFEKVEMELLTESIFQGNVPSTSWAEAFATHFTENYNAFANERPILDDLKTLGKITSVVKWIKDNDIPFDLSYFEDHEPAQTPPCEYHTAPSAPCTPEYTRRITNETGPFAGQYNRIYLDGISISGGVDYQLAKGQNYFESPDDTVTDPVQQAALLARPDETVTCDPDYPDNDCHFKWDFSVNDEDYTAVANSLTRSQKDGNIKKAFLDMSFPVEGNNSLSLVRYYNSFNDKTTGFGFGWDMVPYKLRFPENKKFDPDVMVYAYPRIFINENGSEHLYTLLDLNDNDEPVYIREGGKHYLIENPDNSFTLYTKNKGTVTFDPEGKLTRLTDINGIYIDYNYDASSRLSTISHQDADINGRKIILTYVGNEIERAVGPGGKAA